MKRQRGWENPFQPGAGASPPVLAGREREVSLGRGLLDVLESGSRPSRGLLYFGPRGNGKTVLLARLAKEARRRGMRAEVLPADCFADRGELIGRLQENAGLARAEITGVQPAGFGVSSVPGPRTLSIGRLLASWIGLTESPLVILLDEAQSVEPAAGRIFFAAVQEATMDALPFALIAAGTPDAPRRLRRCGTFMERALRRVPVGRLNRKETLLALEEPARRAGRPISGGAAQRLASESQDYPFFIQLLGSAAWDVARPGARMIDSDAARAGVMATRPEIQDFYAERYEEARARGVHRLLLPLAHRIVDGGGQIDDRALDGLLERSGSSDAQARVLATLTDLGVLWQAAPGIWEMGIPSFAEHVLSRGGVSRGTGAAPRKVGDRQTQPSEPSKPG